MASLATIKSLQGDQLSSTLAAISTWLLIGALGYATALLAIQLLPTSSQSTAVARPLTAKTSSTENTASLAQQIVDAHLFGDEAARATPIAETSEPVEEAPKSKLNVKLAGIMASNDPTIGHALIGGGREDKVVAVGEKIERATLEEVYPLYIVINNGESVSALNFRWWNSPMQAPLHRLNRVDRRHLAIAQNKVVVMTVQ